MKKFVLTFLSYHVTEWVWSVLRKVNQPYVSKKKKTWQSSMIWSTNNSWPCIHKGFQSTLCVLDRRVAMVNLLNISWRISDFTFRDESSRAEKRADIKPIINGCLSWGVLNEWPLHWCAAGSMEAIWPGFEMTGSSIWMMDQEGRTV